MQTTQKTHSEGAVCLEGMKRVPLTYNPCCGSFAAHVVAHCHDMRFEWSAIQRRWVAVIAPEAGGGVIEIQFCPFCGTQLQ
jgi:hypothetical protein